MIKFLSTRLILPAFLLGGLFVVPGFAQMTEPPKYEIDVKRGIVYGQGKIRDNGKETMRDLALDVYMPLRAKTKLPAIIYTHGGSFHIGSPRTGYSVSGAQSTSPADYCRMFAGLGYACFAIEYRLGPEEPIADGIGYAQEHVDRESIQLMMDRVGVIRSNIGLRPLDASDAHDNRLLTDTVLSAAEDLRKALDFVIENAGDFQLDAKRIVLGGFSAGAVTSLNVAHGMNAPVAGVFMLSTAPIGIDIYRTVTGDSAPALFFMGQYDLSGALIANPRLIEHYEKIGLDYTFAWVPAFGHFYPSGAVTMGLTQHFAQ